MHNPNNSAATFLRLLKYLAHALISLFSWHTVLADTSGLRGSVETRIVGGHDAQAGAYPFMGKYKLNLKVF